MVRRIGLAQGSYPAERPDLQALTEPDPYTGRLITYRLLDDGSLELVLEGAAELEKDLREKVTGAFFAVVLPPDGVV